MFLSYARGDDEPFVGRLYRDLCAAGFDVWFDRVTMPNRGLAFTDEIRRAIRAQDRLVLVLGPYAAASSYVRDEWASALALDKPVHPVVRVGDAALLPEPVGIYDARFMQRGADYELELSRLVEQLQAPPPALGALHGVPSLPPHYLERPEVLRELRDALRSQPERRVLITSARVGLQGMGGIGKSVLASALARDTRVRSLFPDGVYWVTIGQDPKLVELQRALATTLGDVGDFDSLVVGRARLHARFRQMQALLVLDDVWHKRDTDAFDVLGPMDTSS